jgi:hypothetical protein
MSTEPEGTATWALTYASWGWPVRTRAQTSTRKPQTGPRERSLPLNLPLTLIFPRGTPSAAEVGYVPCRAGGQGSVVDLAGTAHMLRSIDPGVLHGLTPLRGDPIIDTGAAATRDGG